MRYILAIALAFLLVGNVYADSIPTGTDPKNERTVWTQTVYNGSGSEIVSGLIVAWDFATSEAAENWYDDMCPYIKLQATVDGVWTAGVLPYGRNLANGSTGEIIVRGPAYVRNDNTTPPTAGQQVGAITTTGFATDFTGGSDTCMLGPCILADPANNDACPDGSVAQWCIVYVNPSYEAD